MAILQTGMDQVSFFNWISLVRLYHVFLPPYGQEAFRLLWNQPAVKTQSRYLLARPRA